MKRIRAFTLLEMLLVLAVVSVLALAGIAAYQQRVQSFKVEKTALQMQGIMEAAQAFYIDHASNPPDQRWPAQESDFANYLSGTVLHNCPWTYDASGTCYSIATATPYSSFSVSVTIPTTQTNATQIAQLIMTRLPNASVTGTTITSTISKLPVGASAPPPGFSIINIASVYNGKVLTLHPDLCDANTDHNVYFMLSGLATCGYETAGGTADPTGQCANIPYNPSLGVGGLASGALDALGFGGVTQITPGGTNPSFHLASSVKNPQGTSLTVDMGGLVGSGFSPTAYVSYQGYHMSGVAIETCEPKTSNNAHIPTPPKFY